MPATCNHIWVCLSAPVAITPLWRWLYPSISIYIYLSIYLSFYLSICFAMEGTAWKESNTELLLACIFLYSDWIRRFTPQIFVFSPNTGKYGPEIIPYLDTFHAVRVFGQVKFKDIIYFFKVEMFTAEWFVMLDDLQ